MVIFIRTVKLCVILLIAIAVASFAPQYLPGGIPDASPQFDAPQFGYKKDIYRMVRYDNVTVIMPNDCMAKIISSNRIVEICRENDRY